MTYQPRSLVVVVVVSTVKLSNSEENAGEPEEDAVDERHVGGHDQGQHNDDTGRSKHLTAGKPRRDLKLVVGLLAEPRKFFNHRDSSKVAGEEGLEPPVTVLETVGLAN
jgi:hypothetical protein